MSLYQSIQKYLGGSIDKFELAAQIQPCSHMLDDLCQCLCQSGNSCTLSDKGITTSLKISGVGDVSFYVDLADRFSIATWAMLLGTSYIEQDIFSLFRNLIGPGSVVLDIGANIGWYSVISAKLGASVYAFEPIPRTFHSLEKNVALNYLDHMIRTFNVGCSDRIGKVTFYFDERASGSASARNLNYLQDDGAHQICVAQTTLDDVMHEKEIQQVDLIKCDVEGGELLVFQGGQTLLQRFRPFVICEMLRKHAAKFDYYPDRTIELFSSLGYICLALDKEEPGSAYIMEHMTADTAETNFLFVPQEKLPAAQKLLCVRG